VLVDQLDGEAVELGLGDVADGPVAQRLSHTFVEPPHVVRIHNRLEAQHRDHVTHFGKGGQHAAGDALGW